MLNHVLSQFFILHFSMTGQRRLLPPSLTLWKFLKVRRQSRTLSLRQTSDSQFSKFLYRIILIGFKTIKMAGSNIPRTSLFMHLKAEHAQFNRKSDFFKIGTFQGRSFTDRWSKETRTLGTRVERTLLLFEHRSANQVQAVNCDRAFPALLSTQFELSILIGSLTAVR